MRTEIKTCKFCFVVEEGVRTNLQNIFEINIWELEQIREVNSVIKCLRGKQITA